MTHRSPDQPLTTDVPQAHLSRRNLLKWAGALTVGSGLALGLLAACADEDDGEEPAGADDDDEASADDETGDEGTEDDEEDAPEDPSELGGDLVIGRQEDAESLDPIRSGAFASGDTMALIYDTLTCLDMDGSVQPNIAESWDTSDDGLSYTFVLRQGITFHDGTELNAEAVKAHFDRTIDPETAGRSAGWISALDETNVDDDYTVELVLSSQFAPLLNTLTITAFGIPSPAAVEEHGDDFGQNPVGSGPFQFVEWVSGDQIVLEKYPDYQCFLPYVENTGPPYLDAVTFRVIPEMQSLIAAFEAGEVNLIQLPPQHVDTFVDRDGYQTYSKETAGTLTNFVEFTLGQPPFDDALVRQAFAHAIDVDTIINSVLEGQAVRNFCFMPVGLPGWTEECEQWGYAYDPDRSNELLDEAGWATGDDGVRERDGEQLEILFTTFSAEPFSGVAQVIQNLAGQVGFSLEIQTFEVGTQLEAISRDEPDSHADLINWGFSTSHLLYLMTHSDQPLGRYESDEFNEVIEQTFTEEDPESRAELYADAQRILLEDVAGVPLYTDIYTYATPDSVQGFYLGPLIQSYLGTLVYQDTYIEG